MYKLIRKVDLSRYVELCGVLRCRVKILQVGNIRELVGFNFLARLDANLLATVSCSGKGGLSGWGLVQKEKNGPTWTKTGCRDRVLNSNKGAP